MTKTNFNPPTDGFAFVNYWTFDQTEMAKLGGLFAGAVNDALELLNPLFNSTFILSGLNRKLMAWCDQVLPESYGLCGGMAFAALDYFNKKIPIPRDATVPTRANAPGTTMRDYLERRQIDSLKANLPAVLEWMVVLNLIPQWWSFKGGGSPLLERTKAQWASLKKSIDAGQPCPLALIGTTSNPTENHQVLATGYDDHGDGTGIIYAYDMNCPGAEQTIQLDFRGSVLQTIESCPSDMRGPLRGFICEKYASVTPPKVLAWTTPAVQNV